MAEEARKEPSMEEILSSIRKIISDDDPVTGDAEVENAALEPADQAFGTPFGDDELDLSDELEESLAAPTFADPTEALEEEAPAMAAPAPAPKATSLRSIARKEPVEMMTAPLSDSKTADDAASYLSKLLDQVEFGEEGGSDKSIDNLVKELLRPMMKAWLDENLPAVVERHVEAEVARIARMAR